MELATPSSHASPSKTSGEQLFPKGPARQKKTPKPLRRRSWLKRSANGLHRKSPLRRSSPLKKRVGSDAASFRPEDVQAVHGSDLACFLNGTRHHLEKHHVLGRGELFGIRPGDPR